MVHSHKLTTSENPEKSTIFFESTTEKLSMLKNEKNGEVTTNELINFRNGSSRLRLHISEKPVYKEESSEDDYKAKKAKPRRKRKVIRCAKKSSNSESSRIEHVEERNLFTKKVTQTNGRKRKIADGEENVIKKKTGQIKDQGQGRKEQKDSPTKSKSSRRKVIRNVLKNDELTKETKDAEKQEMKRRKRLQSRKDDKLVELDVDKSVGVTITVPVTKRLVLQKRPLVEVHPDITVHLKPHQVEGIKFIWDNLIESTKQAEKESGGGCILAHCMGLGKTLQTIAVVHTVLCSKHLSLKTVLVVVPLNTVLNWMDELNRWTPEEDPLTLYNLNEYQTTRSRLGALKEWAETGGVMVIGYDMFRLLASCRRIRFKAWKVAFSQLLLDPGPDIIVCDEGHRLKNSDSNISVIMSKVETARRLILTGTPLQNNLMEYQCMVNFVKPNLLGSVKEFRNRFVNPILNGQHSDSTIQDVRLMKKRCHILHNMLQGFVQRKDYTALTKYLCEKLEFIVKVRLTPLQNQLYRYYLDTQTNRGANQHATVQGTKDSGLFADYQNLMRVWTHPRVLQLYSKRQEYLSQFIYCDSSDEDASEISDQEREWESEEQDNVCDPAEDLTVTSDETATLPTSHEVDDSDGSFDSFSSIEEVRPRDHRLRRRRGGYLLRGGESDSDDEKRRLEDEAEREANKLENNSWYSSILKESAPEIDSPAAGGKVAALFEILRLAQEFNDKVLVFSQSLLSLDLIEEMLELSTMKAVSLEEESADIAPRNESDSNSKEQSTKLPEWNNDLVCQKWYKNIDYFRMDGSSLSKHRQKWINEFNDESDRRARLFLISTKAGSLGVNLVAANRVVIFDASWNPTHDIQSIFRIYRFGQTKACYIYRLIAQGTMEERIYDRQVAKQSLSFRVIDEQQINRYFTAHDLQELYTFSPSVAEPGDKRPTLPKDKLLAELLVCSKSLISSYHTHDSLLDHQEEEELTEEERRTAWEEYENEKKGIKPKPIVNDDADKTSHSNDKLQQSALRQQKLLKQQLQRLKERKKLKRIAAQLQIKDFKSSTSTQEQAKSILFLLMKATEQEQKAARKLQELQPLDFVKAVINLRKLPMYDSMKEDSLKRLAVELKMRRQQLRLTAEKEHRQAKAQVDWLSTTYSKFCATPSENNSKSSATITSSVQNKNKGSSTKKSFSTKAPTASSSNHTNSSSNVPNSLLLQHPEADPETNVKSSTTVTSSASKKKKRLSSKKPPSANEAAASSSNHTTSFSDLSRLPMPENQKASQSMSKTNVNSPATNTSSSSKESSSAKKSTSPSSNHTSSFSNYMPNSLMLQKLSDSLKASAPIARITLSDVMKTQSRPEVQPGRSRKCNKEATKPNPPVIVIDSDDENSFPLNVTKLKPGSAAANPIYVVDLKNDGAKTTASTDTPSTSKTTPTPSMPVIQNSSFTSIKPKSQGKQQPLPNSSQQLSSLLFRNTFPQLPKGDDAFRFRLLPQLLNRRALSTGRIQRKEVSSDDDDDLISFSESSEDDCESASSKTTKGPTGRTR